MEIEKGAICGGRRPRRITPSEISKINLSYLGLKYICVLFEFKYTESFTSHGGYLLNTTL